MGQFLTFSVSVFSPYNGGHRAIERIKGGMGGRVQPRTRHKGAARPVLAFSFLAHVSKTWRKAAEARGSLELTGRGVHTCNLRQGAGAGERVGEFRWMREHFPWELPTNCSAEQAQRTGRKKTGSMWRISGCV